MAKNNNQKKKKQEQEQKQKQQRPSAGLGKQSQRMYCGMIIIVAIGVLFIILSSTHTQHNVISIHEQGQQLRKDFLGDSDPSSSSSSSSSSSLQIRRPKSTTPNYHMVFSTSCDDQQHWESYVFFYHAYIVKQKGTVTRICSGCNENESKQLIDFHTKHIETLNPKFKLHLTPAYHKSLTGAHYKYMNKPYGLRNWMESKFPNIIKSKQNNNTNSTSTSTSTTINTDANDDEKENGIVMLLDPDMILLRPLVHDFNNEDVIFADETIIGNKNKKNKKIVSNGNPIAQQDGYLDSKWSKLNITFVTDGKKLPKDFNGRIDGPLYWNTGPPYLATVHDMYNIATLWCDYAPRVYKIHPELFAEMYGYIIATTQLNLPHTLIKSIVISSTASKNREGWKYIDDIPDEDICLPQRRNLPSTQTKMPIGLHYCKRYALGKNFFSKYRLKKKYISCECPLLNEPPINMLQQNHSNQGYYPPPHGYNFNEVWPDKTLNVKPYQVKREVFMLCSLISKINEAALYWKEKNCVNDPNNENNNNNNNNKLNKEYYDIFVDPNH